MNTSQSHSFHFRGALFVLLLLPCIFMFQNCGAGLEDEGVTNSSSSQNEEEHPVIFSNDKPFPFKVSANYLAYMSCSSMSSVNTEAYFSFKVGAFKDPQVNAVGLGLSEKFLERTRLYEAGNRITFLQDNLPVEGVALQFGINKINDFVPPRADTYTHQILPPLQGDAIIKKLSKNLYNPVSFFDNIKGVRKRSVYGSFSVNNKNEQFNEELRLLLSGQSGVNNSYLTLGFSIGSGGGNGYLLGPRGIAQAANKESNAFGVGYKLNFSGGLSLDFSKVNGRRNVLSSVQEVDLSTGRQNNSSWDCNDNKYKLMVVRYQDATHKRFNSNASFCERTNAGLDLSRPDHKAIAQMIKLEHWYVNLNQRCITPRRPSSVSCYGNQPQDAVNYFGLLANKNCGGATRDTTNGNVPVHCPNYVSICRKISE